ncbi:MAG: hypothetical protein ACUVQ1_02835 [Candidatus Kapaibacteriales bacterium]
MKEVYFTNDSTNLIYILVRYKKFLAIFVSILTLGSVIIAFLLPDQFTAVVNTVPPKTTASTMESLLGGLSSTLKDIGLTKLTGKTEGIYSFLVILDSRSVKDSIIRKYRFDTVYNISISKFTKLRKAFENNLEISLEPEGNYVISFTDEDPVRAANVANEYVQIANLVAQDIFQKEARYNRRYLEERIQQIDNSLNLVLDSIQKFSRANLMFSPIEQSKAIGQSYIDLKSTAIAQEIVYDMFKSKYGENDPITSAQKNILDNVKRKLYEFENKPGFIGNYSLKEFAKVGGDFLRLYAEFETLTKVKSFLIPYLEENKLNENRSFHYLIVLDKAVPPDRKSKPKRSLIIAGTFLGSLILGFLVVIVFDSLSNYFSQFNKATSGSENDFPN